MRSQAFHVRDALHQGLCSGCVHGIRCTFRGRLRQPLRQCLEFEPDDSDHRQVLARGEGRPWRTRGEVDSGMAAGGLGDGLCMSCLRRSACDQNGPDGRVWFCSGYG